jgi:carbamoyltransferase
VLIAGVSGGARNASAALARDGRLVGACAQERVTRVRGAGVGSRGFPDEALDALLEPGHTRRADVARYVVAEPTVIDTSGASFDRVEHHLAHASTAYYSSALRSAVVVVCDHEPPYVTVWEAKDREITRVDWPWRTEGFSGLYSRCAAAFGFGTDAAGQRLEALARLWPDTQDAALVPLLRLGDEGIVDEPSLQRFIEDRIGADKDPGSPSRGRLAAAIQSRIGELFLEFLGRVKRRVGGEQLCLAGDFAYHSSMNTLARRSGPFARVFVPVDPGNAGLSAGVALRAVGPPAAPISPFLGPSYSPQEMKDTLDNCKLQYSLESEDAVIGQAVRALKNGNLVGWFDGPMEWGARALGARCILANPSAPYVLENLNRFLKRREPWRGYALSGIETAVREHFDGPETAPFMECDYRPRDPDRFLNALPRQGAAVRIQTVSDGPPRFRRLLEAFGDATRLPFLINTSFNGFHEPIVCSPRDAVRVFYGTGIDLLIVDRFVLRK